VRLLAIDTALGACSACVIEPEGDASSRETIFMQRGHAEALLPLVERVMAHAKGGFASIGRVAVTVGPGSFTGLRVGIAAARAIGLAIKVPVVGVTTLSALVAPMLAAGDPRLLAAAIDARHGQIYFHLVAPGGRTVVAPRLLPVMDAARLIGTGPVVMAGSAAALLRSEASLLGIDAALADGTVAPDIAWVGRLGLAADPAQALPKPFYLRAPDAKPQAHGQLPRR
jgi:tRNA threonylcarbamoyladenosine biosynthesis protein TsaB